MRQALRPHGVRAATIACPGLDFFGYYALTDRVLTLHPRVIVLTANLRLFAPTGLWSYTDLLGLAPLAELPRLIMLPYDRRGTSAAQIVLAQTLRWPGMTDALLWFEGMRHVASDAAIWDALGPAALKLKWGDGALQRGLDVTLRGYVRPFESKDPMVRMVAATTARAGSDGAHVLVVVSPVPVDALRLNGLYDEAAFAERIAALRQATESNGGTLLDLHDSLPMKKFTDFDGHFTDEGEKTMVNLTTPAIIETVIRAGVVKAPPS
jgi:hypothetical protein